MYYYCKKSKKRIIHLQECFHTLKLDDENWGSFETLAEAYEQGYRLCKHCNLLAKQYRKEHKGIINFCQRKGLRVSFGYRNIAVASVHSKWLIAIDEKSKFILYHKNTFETEKDCLSEIKGYHKQYDVLKGSIIDYLNYIVEHDYFRMMRPVQGPKKKKEYHPPRKGTRRYKSAQRRIEKIKRKEAIDNVLNLIDSLNIEPTQVPAMAM